jgi:hypothetical protein
VQADIGFEAYRFVFDDRPHESITEDSMGDDRIEEIDGTTCTISQQKTTSNIRKILNKSGVQDSPTGFQIPDGRDHLDDINQWQKFPMPPMNEELYIDNDDFQLGTCMVATGTERLPTRGTAIKTGENGDEKNVTDSRYFSVKTGEVLRRSARQCSNLSYTALEAQQTMANTKFDEYSKLFTVKPSQIAEKGLFARKTVSAGYEIDYYGEYFPSMDDLRAAGHGDSAYVMGNYKCTGRDQDGGKIYTGVVVNGIAIPEQFAIYANHQPGACANARFHWDEERYLGRCTTGQPVLIITRTLRPGEEVTADYGPLFDYARHHFRRRDRHVPVRVTAQNCLTAPTNYGLSHGGDADIITQRVDTSHLNGAIWIGEDNTAAEDYQIDFATVTFISQALKAAQHIAAEDQQMEVLLSVIHAAEDDMVNGNINSIQMDVIRDLEPLQQLVIEPHGRKLSVIVASANRVQADRQWEKLFPKLHRMLVDTGNAPRNIGGVHLNGQLSNARQSRALFTGAFGAKLTRGEPSGTLSMSVLGVKNYSTKYQMDVTTIASVQQDLMSFFALFEDGFNLIIDDVFPHLKHRRSGQVLPIFLDPDRGGWYLVYCLEPAQTANPEFGRYVQWYLQKVQRGRRHHRNYRPITRSCSE